MQSTFKFLYALIGILILPPLGLASTVGKLPAVKEEEALPPLCFISSLELRQAVDAYLFDDSSDTEVAMVYGWPIGTWCVDEIDNFDSLFSIFRNRRAARFNEDLSGWNVSSATSMDRMFLFAFRFNQDLCAWGELLDASSTSFNIMFRGTSCQSRVSPFVNVEPGGPFCHYCFPPSSTNVPSSSAPIGGPTSYPSPAEPTSYPSLYTYSPTELPEPRRPSVFPTPYFTYAPDEPTALPTPAQRTYVPHSPAPEDTYQPHRLSVFPTPYFTYAPDEPTSLPTSTQYTYGPDEPTSLPTSTQHPSLSSTSEHTYGPHSPAPEATSEPQRPTVFPTPYFTYAPDEPTPLPTPSQRTYVPDQPTSLPTYIQCTYTPDQPSNVPSADDERTDGADYPSTFPSDV